MITPIADVSLGVLLAVFFVYGLGAFIFVIFSESFALWILRWGSYLRSLRDSALANIVTTFFGISMYVNFAPSWLDISSGSKFSTNMFIMWAVSAIVESVAFYLVSKKPYWEVLLISCVINLCSYIPLTLWILETFSV